jgi:hypothetical protein
MDKTLQAKNVSTSTTQPLPVACLRHPEQKEEQA